MRDVVVGIEDPQGVVLERAAAEAASCGRALRAVRVSPAKADEEQAYEYRGSGELARVVTQVQAGDVGPALVGAALEAGLVVVGTRGRRTLRTVLLGSVTSYVVHYSQAPVMVVPASARPELPVTRVVAGVDGSGASRSALRWAADAAKRHDCPLLVMHAWLLSTLPSWPVAASIPTSAQIPQLAQKWLEGEVADALPDPPACLSLRAPHGTPTTLLLEAVAPEDLIVVGSRGQGGFSTLLLGSTAVQLAHHAQSPVVLVRQGEERLGD